MSRVHSVACPSTIHTNILSKYSKSLLLKAVRGSLPFCRYTISDVCYVVLQSQPFDPRISRLIPRPRPKFIATPEVLKAIRPPPILPQLTKPDRRPIRLDIRPNAPPHQRRNLSSWQRNQRSTTICSTPVLPMIPTRFVYRPQVVTDVMSGSSSLWETGAPPHDMLAESATMYAAMLSS